MSLYLLILFIVLPLVEIYIFILVGSAIGAFTTISLIILTACLGAIMMRSQGIKIWTKIRSQLNNHTLPAQALWHGLLILLSGVLLITPGFITDTVGLMLFIPQVRIWLLKTLIHRWLQKKFTSRIRFINGEYNIID